jgi:hypothetical protein
MKKHGLSHHPLYRVYASMIQRCYNENNPGYKNYGGRGIEVCDAWKNDPGLFLDYIERLPNFGEDGYSIDRINNDGNYEPGNLRWADRFIQANNKRPPKNNSNNRNGETPITPLRMPLELKERAKKQAEREGKTLSQYIFSIIEADLVISEFINSKS